MAERIDLPPQLQGTEEAQLQQLWSYLYQLSEAINNNLDAIGGNELTDSERVAINQILNSAASGDMNADPVAQASQQMETLKSLIIKTAEFVQTTLTEYRMVLFGETIAQSQFGTVNRRTGMDVAVTPEGTLQKFSLREIVKDLKLYEVNSKNYIKTGLLRTVNSIPVYGVAVGKDIVTFEEDGTEVYHDANKVAELTADELSFYQNSQKIASYTGTALEFYVNGTKRLRIDSTGVTFLNGTTKLAELLNDALKFYSAGTLKSQMDADGIGFYNGNTKLAELLNSALKFYSNGTLRSQMDSDGVGIYNGNTLLSKFTGNRIGFYYNGTEVFYILNGKIYSAGDLEITSGKKLNITSGEMNVTGSAVSIKSGSTFEVESQNFNINSQDKEMECGYWKFYDAGVDYYNRTYLYLMHFMIANVHATLPDDDAFGIMFDDDWRPEGTWGTGAIIQIFYRKYQDRKIALQFRITRDTVDHTKYTAIFEPSETDLIDLGETTNRFKSLHCGNVFTDLVYTDSVVSTYLQGTLINGGGREPATTNETNLNNLNKSRFYRMEAAGLTNIPTGLTGDFVLDVTEYGPLNNVRVLQKIISETDLYTRWCKNGTWGSWYKFAGVAV